MDASENRFRGAGSEPSDLVGLLRLRAELQPDRRAYTFLLDGETEKASLSYGELDSQARAIGAWLQAQAAPGERALLLFPPGLEYITAFFGCLYAGIIAVPAYPPSSERNMERLEAIAADAQATIALTTTPVLSRARRIFASSPHFSALRWLATDEAAGAGGGAWREPAVSADSLAFLQYTSGSTGTPRGVMLSHGNLLHNLSAFNGRFELGPDGLLVAWQPLFHDMGLIGMVLNPLYGGFPLVLMSPLAFLQHPLRWLQAVSRYGAKVSGAPSFAYDLCVRKITPEQRRQLDLSAWQVAVIGAEPVRLETVERFADAFAPCGFRREAFYPCYGLAEATLIVSGGPRSHSPHALTLQKAALERGLVVDASESGEGGQPITCCGPPLDGLSVVIAQPDSARECPPGMVGEIWVSGPSVAQGYWRRPGETDEVFRARLSGGGGQTFLRTGDLGFVRDGEVYVTGRLKDLIIIRGLNHYPQDIEATAEKSHPALRRGYGAAFSVEAGGEERLVLAYEVEQGRAIGIGEVADAVRGAIASEHETQVHAIVLLKSGSLPLTSSGKVRRRNCRAKFLAGGLDVIAQWQESAETEDRLLGSSAGPEGHGARDVAGRSATAEEIRAWLLSRLSRRLGCSPGELDPLKPFASYGLDSAESVGLSAEMGNWLGRPLPPTLAWDYPNVELLARHLAQESDRPTRGTEPGARRHDAAEAVAVIGIGCRFPGGPNPEAFWRLLRDGVDAVTEVPADRWDVNAFYDPEPSKPGKMNTRWGGFLPDVASFDAQFFGISPREAVRTDPQQRLLLEVAWEALEDAGQSPRGLAGTPVGVFVGISVSDYAQLLLKDPSHMDVYDGTGSALSIAANRLSYSFDFRGPSVAVDTACSSSLVAVHMACQSLRAGESDVALAGGVNLILIPEVTVNLSQARMMSGDGRCKPFDAAADGYVRGEGCGLVVLKRLSDALSDGDHIMAVIMGTAVNQDGRSNGLTAPNGPAQQAVIRAALRNAAVEPSRLGYVEAHGSGTPLGDPIEWQALEEVLKSGGGAAGQCAVGSVKTNVGHLEAAAGIAGLIKTVLALDREEIPAHLHLNKINPHISLEDSPLTVASERRPWPKGAARRYAGVSSFGFGGTNAHVVLAEAPPRPERPPQQAERPIHILTLSARSEGALRDLARRYQEHLTRHPANAADVCHTANAGREHFGHRLASVAGTTEQLAEQLRMFSEGREAKALWAGHPRVGERPRVAFLFTGQGSQFTGMGRELYSTQPAFRSAIDRCAELLGPELDRPLQSLLYDAAEGPSPLDETAYAQPALFALEYALAELWRSWGVEPDAVMGHSLGEYVAACVAGVFGVEEGLRLVAERGRLMQALPERGMMAVVFADAGRVTPFLAAHEKRVSVAAVNGPASTVISGAEDAVRAVLRRLESEDINARPLQAVSHAFHSPLVEPMLDEFERAARSVEFAPPRLPLVSNLTGRVLEHGEAPDADYWRRHTREAVQFAPGMSTLAERGVQVYLEIGPRPTLLGMGRACQRDSEAAWLPSLQREGEDWQTLARSVAALYVGGVDVDWKAFDRDYPRGKVALPTYPFERQRFWLNAAQTPRPAAVTRRAQSGTPHPLLGRQLS